MLDHLPLITIAFFYSNLLLLVFSMLWVAYWDVRTFEINYEVLGIAPWCYLAFLIASEGNLISAIFAGCVMFGVALLIHRVFHQLMGMGDYVLYAFIGLVAGVELLPLLVVANAAFSTLTAAIYSLKRGKRMFRSMFPAALPGMAAAMLCLMLPLVEVAFNITIPLGWLRIDLDIAPSIHPSVLVLVAPIVTTLMGIPALLWAFNVFKIGDLDGNY